MHPSLHIQQIASLPEPKKSLALSAVRGVVADVDELHDVMCDAPTPHKVLCIPAFYVHLNVDDLPHLRDKQKTISIITSFPDRLVCALLALKAWIHLQEHLVAEAREEVWLSAWAWIQFLEEVNVKRAPGLQPSADDMRFMFLRVIMGVSFVPDAPPFASFVMSQPRIREFMAAGWLACLNLEDISWVLLGAICTFVDENSDMSNPAHVRDLVAGAGGTMNDLASLTVKYLRRFILPACERQLPDEVMARISITLLTALALADHSPLKDDLVSNGIVDVLCRTLWVFGASDMPLTKGVLPFTMDRLITYMDVVPRMARLKEALDAGLLRAIMLCGTREDTKFFEKQVPTLLGSILPEAPLPQSVLSSLRAGLDDASPLTHTIAFRESKLFEGFLRATAVKLYRGELGHDKACNNVQCISSTKSDDDLKQCSKCRSAFYCSQQCQSQDWNAHRKFCRMLLRQREIRRGADEFIAQMDPELAKALAKK